VGNFAVKFVQGQGLALPEGEASFFSLSAALVKTRATQKSVGIETRISPIERNKPIHQAHIPYIVRACPFSKGECEGLLPENPFISPLPPLPKSKDKPPACCHAAHTWEIGFPPLLRTRLALKSG
jgi:hypothetical protein